MTRQFMIRSAAIADTNDIHAYYIERSTDSAKRFIRDVYQAYLLIEGYPLLYKRIQGKLRRYIMKSFPYQIIYTADEANIDIIGIFHTSRNDVVIVDRLGDEGA